MKLLVKAPGKGLYPPCNHGKTMKIVKIWNDDPSDRQLNEIAAMLEDGQTVIYPTDTLYAIGCDATNPKAVEKICKLKGINPDKTNLSIICSNISMIADYARIGDRSFALLKEYTPGPYTFLLKANSTLPKAFKGRKTVGVRIPSSDTIRLIAEKLGKPILTTSIEFDDDDYAINPGLIAENYNDRVDIFIEGPDGLTEPSTIIDCTESDPVLVRQGKGVIDLD